MGEVMYPYVYSGPREASAGTMGRAGQRCRVLAHDSADFALVEFTDGGWAVVSRTALQRADLASGATYDRCRVFTTASGQSCPMCDAEVRPGVEHVCSRPKEPARG